MNGSITSSTSAAGSDASSSLRPRKPEEASTSSPSLPSAATSSSPESSPNQQDTFLQPIFDSLFSPGLNSPTQRLMNYCFYGLFLTLLLLALGTGGNIHVVFLLGVAIALWGSVNWFLAELAKMPPSVRQPQQMPDEGSSEQELDVSASPGTEEKKEL